MFTEPRTPASTEFAALVTRRDDAARRVRDLEAAQRQASADAVAAAEAVSDAERQEGHGEPVTDAERKRRERELIKARERRAEPWPERITGARRAVAECEREILAHAGAHYDELMAELEQDARAAAERVNAALHELRAAYEARQHEDQRVNRLITLATGNNRPGLVMWSKLEKIAQEWASVPEYHQSAAARSYCASVREDSPRRILASCLRDHAGRPLFGESVRAPSGASGPSSQSISSRRRRGSARSLGPGDPP
jgi:hypothetical protein